jgi:hypothetical protein
VGQYYKSTSNSTIKKGAQKRPFFMVELLKIAYVAKLQAIESAQTL